MPNGNKIYLVNLIFWPKSPNNPNDYDRYTSACGTTNYVRLDARRRKDILILEGEAIAQRRGFTNWVLATGRSINTLKVVYQHTELDLKVVL